MTIDSLSGSTTEDISLPVMHGQMPNSFSATSKANWLFLSWSRSSRESKSLQRGKERQNVWSKGGNTSWKFHRFKIRVFLNTVFYSSYVFAPDAEKSQKMHFSYTNVYKLERNRTSNPRLWTSRSSGKRHRMQVSSLSAGGNSSLQSLECFLWFLTRDGDFVLFFFSLCGWKTTHRREWIQTQTLWVEFKQKQKRKSKTFANQSSIGPFAWEG